jgi:hypothetical protein
MPIFLDPASRILVFTLEKVRLLRESTVKVDWRFFDDASSERCDI